MNVPQSALRIAVGLCVVCISPSALGQGPDADKALAALIHQLGDKDDAVRENAVKQIHGMGRKVIPQVLGRMDDPNKNLRYGVALVVERFGAESVPFLTP